MSEDNPTGVSVTIKAGTGFDVPWIVLHGADVAHVRAMLAELNDSDLTQGVVVVARKFHGTYAGANPASGHGAPTQSAPTAPASPAPAASAPPPSFVDNQQAQPAGWGTAQVQQATGATVMGQFPNELANCPTHNAPRTFYAPGVSRTTNKPYGASLRCQIQGCKPVWQNPNGSWS